MRRYLFLLPLLLIVFAADFAAPRSASAQDCLAHDETLTIDAETGDWEETTFDTSIDCNYKIEVSGQYEYNNSATVNADAFYDAIPLCNPAVYEADHCMVWDFAGAENLCWGIGLEPGTSQPRGEWLAGEGCSTKYVSAGVTSKDELYMGISANNAAGRSIRHIYADMFFDPGQGSSYITLNGLGCGGTIATMVGDVDYDGGYTRTDDSGTFCTGLRIIALASFRQASGRPAPNPRGSGLIRYFSIYWDGASVTTWDVPTDWEPSANLTFEPTLLGGPASINWTDPYPEYNPDGEYETVYSGTGDPYRFRIEDDNYADNDGSLTVHVYATDAAPAREFVRPLEIGDVSSTYDWWDSNGTPDPAGRHCERVDDALNVITGYTDCQQVNRVALNHVPNTVVQSSIDAFAAVHASLGGTVLERRAILGQDCTDMTTYDYGGNIYTGTFTGANCLIEIPNWATPNDRALFMESVATPIYLVRVLHDDNSEMRYLVTNPRVNAGQNIRDSCVLGETIPTSLYSNVTELRKMFTPLFLEALPDASSPSVWTLFNDIIDTTGSAPGGIVVMGYRGVAQEEVEFLGPPFTNYDQIILEDYSPAANSCDTTANFSDCISYNPQFYNEGEDWLNGNPSVPVFWTNPGVILEPGASVILPSLPLDDATPYGASAQVEQLVENTFGNGQIKISIGQSSYTNSVFGTVRTVVLEEQTHVANAGVLYDISIENVGENDLKVHYFCLTEGAAEVVGQCLLDNYSFDMGMTGWDTDGAVVSPGVPGSVELEHGEYVEQSVLLFPETDGPHDYTIQIEATIPGITGGEISIWWGGIVPAGEIIHIIPGIGFAQTYTFTRTLTVTTSDTQPLTITAGLPELDSEEPFEGAITLHRVCILGPYPQQGGGGVDVEQPEGCAQIPFPSGGDVQTVLQWHWWQIDRFNRCTFIPKLNEVYKAIVKGFNDLAMQFKYWRQVVYSASAWAETKLFPWLAGYMSNITPGTIYIEGGGSCNDIFCVLSSLIDGILRPIVDLIIGLVQQAANLLFGVIGGFIVLIIQTIAALVGLLQTALGMVAMVFNAFITATPQVPDGFPSCSTDPTGGICVIWWIAENTIFSGTIGQLFIPTMLAVGYTMLGLHVVSEVKGIIREIGGSV